MTEELAAGLAVGLSDNVPLYMFGVPLTKNYIYGAFFYNNLYDDAVYHVKIYGETYHFTSPDFIQGAITDAQWLGLSPHSVITELYMINEDGSEILLNFN